MRPVMVNNMLSNPFVPSIVDQHWRKEELITRKGTIIVGTVLAAVVSAGVAHAGETSKPKESTLWGAGIGAIAGGLLGGSVTSAAQFAVRVHLPC